MEYIGMRYITKFADPIQWDDTRQYEHLTVVQYQGATYVSKRPVPVGIQITNTDYWILWADFNAQIEQYRQEVRAYDGRITQAEGDAADALEQVGTLDDAVAAINAILAGYAEGDTVKADVSSLQTAIGNVDAKIGTLPEGETDVVSYVGGEVQIINTDLDGIDTTLAGFDPTTPVKPYIDNAIAGLSDRKKMLVIGDSLSGSTHVAADSRWCVLLAERLNADLYVFQANGAGYANPGVGSKTFQTLVADAHTSTQFDDEDIDYVFIFGGTNDISEAMLPSAVSGAFDDTLTAARQYFTNAKLYICSTTARYDHLKLVPTTRRGEVYQLKAWRNRPSFVETGAILLPLTFVLGFNENYYLGNSDHIHLNASGHQKVANAIWDMMNGIPVSVYFTGAMQAVDDTSVGLFRCSASPIGLQVFGYTQAAAGANSYLHDQYLIFREAGFDNFWNGIAITGSNGGYIGGYSTEDNGLHFVGYGAFNGYVPLA